MKLCWTLAALLAFAPAARAEVKTQEVDYSQDGTALQGVFAWDDAAHGKRPGVLVVHEWWGLNQHARNQAKRLAGAGYVAFALDMYGKGKVTTHPADAQAFAQEVAKNPELMRARFLAALDVLRKNPHVDPARVAAFGYCFGGSVVLSMARQGVDDLAAVVSFHGGLGGLLPAKPGQVKARVLVLNGAEDPFATPELIAKFKKEMTDAGAHYEFVNLAGAKHSFTNPDADKVGMPALAYNAAADKKSWELAMKLLHEVFGK
jgi:dienelactone hydrolase